MTVTTIGGRELLLTITNEGKGYAERVTHGAMGAYTNNPQVVARVARAWVQDALVGAAKYEREFGSPGASCFSVTDILSAALELAEYYEQRERDERAAIERASA